MYVVTVADYDIFTNLNITNDFYNMTLSICTNNEINIDIFIPSLLLRKSCGLSFLS